MLNPFACEPLTLKLDSADGGYVGQMSITFPFTEPEAEPLSVMLPFDQTSPVMLVVEVPVKDNEGAEPLQLPGSVSGSRRRTGPVASPPPWRWRPPAWSVRLRAPA